MRRTDALIAERLAAWGDVPHGIPEVFPDPTPGAIGAAVDAWCRRALGAEPVDAELFAVSVGSVWDSLAVQREPVLVGGVAHLFTSDFRAPDRAQIPTLDEALAFIADYKAARGAPFGGEEHAAARAALVYAMAYTARCEHSDLLTEMGSAAARPERAAEPVPPSSAHAFVAAHAEALLARQTRPAPVKSASAASSSSWKRTSRTAGCGVRRRW